MEYAAQYCLNATGGISSNFDGVSLKKISKTVENIVTTQLSLNLRRNYGFGLHSAK